MMRLVILLMSYVLAVVVVVIGLGVGEVQERRGYGRSDLGCDVKSQVSTC